MTRGRALFALVLVVLASVVIPVDGQQTDTAPSTAQKAKSVMRKVYEEDQKWTAICKPFESRRSLALNSAVYMTAETTKSRTTEKWFPMRCERSGE